MGDENETTDTSGFFSSLVDDETTASADVLGTDDVPAPVAPPVDVPIVAPQVEEIVEEIPEAPRNLVGSLVAGRDWTFLLAWALIGIGVLFVLWALVTNG